MQLENNNKGLKQFFRKLLKWFSIFLLLFLLVGYTVFKSSFIQTLICSKLGDYLSKKTETTISIGEVDFSPFDEFVFKNLLVLDHRRDTMLFSANFSFEINSYDFKELNFDLDIVDLRKALVNIKTYKGEKQSNLQMFINKLKKSKHPKNIINPKIHVSKIKFENLRCIIWNENIAFKNNEFDFNHLDFSNVELEVSELIYENKSLKLNTKQLAFKEISGFELLGMSCEFLINEKKALINYLEFETDETDLNGKIQLNYESFNSFNNFFSDVVLDTYFEETKISSNDVAYFVKTLDGLNQSITFEGIINGPICNLNSKKLKFNYGEHTKFDGEIQFDGLGIKENPEINAKISNLVTYESDIKNIPLPPFTLGKKVKTPKWMKKVGKMEFKGNFVGPISNFEAMGIMKTNAGSIKTDVQFKKDSLLGETKITGKIITNEFDIGKTINNPNFGLISMNGEINALAQFDNNHMKFSGKIPRIDFKGYSYSNISMDGALIDKVFNGMVNVNDSNLVFDFDGNIDFSFPKLQKYDFTANLKKANLRKINWSLRDSSTQVSAKLKVNMKGDQFEDLNGQLKLNNLIWAENGKLFKIDSCYFNSVKKEDREMITLKSDILDAKIEGVYNLSEVYPTIISVLSKEIPSFKRIVAKKNNIENNAFSIMFKLYDYKMIHELFTPKINFSPKTRLNGRFDDRTKSFRINFASDSIFISNKSIHNVKIFSNNQKNSLNILGSLKFFQLIDKLGVENIHFNSLIQNNNLSYNISYENNSNTLNHGEISGGINLCNLDSIKINVTRSNFVHQDTIWKLDNTFKICLADKYIDVKNFNLHSDSQFFKINGTSSMLNSDRMVFEINNFQLNSLSQYWSTINLDLQGKASGSIKLHGGFNEQLFFTDLSVSKMKLNEQKFGKLQLNTFYKSSSKVINLNISIANKKNNLNNLFIEGEYYPFEKGRIKLNANLRNTELFFLERYFEGVFSKFNGGKTSGNLAINGTLSHPLFQGELNVDHLRFSVDYLNVIYGADAQKLQFKDDLIKFDNFTLSHDLHPKSKAKINGFVNINGFKNISYQMDSVFLEDFYCLNTTIKENSTYYGQAYVDGLLQFKGDGKTNYIGGNVSTTTANKFDTFKEKYVSVSTSLELPLDESEELEISEFASFVNLNETNSKKVILEEDFDVSGIDLDLNIRINPEANLRILFDPAVGDEINAKGNGSVGMLINSDGKFNMYGDFSVTKGNYFFTLQNIIGKKFIVEPGSKISWNGDPLDAQMNITTFYRSRANLINLVDTAQAGDSPGSIEKFDNRIQVNTNIGLFGSLWKPQLKIGVSLPNGTPEEKDFLREKVYGNDEINRQAFSLILTSQFLPLSSGVGSIVSDKAGLHNGMQFVEGQINNALSGLIHPNLDLGVDYNEVEENKDEENLTKDELRLLAGFKYKNLSLKTDYDINNQVGDIEAEFKITESLKAKAYHKTTTDATALNNQINTTYGLGAAYQKSFDYFKALFKKKNKEIVD
tara:strand:+ start:4976 stop:9472 length:4497 start_codon:yes stop_codon:yes gene_type:complete